MLPFRILTPNENLPFVAIAVIGIVSINFIFNDLIIKRSLLLCFTIFSGLIIALAANNKEITFDEFSIPQLVFFVFIFTLGMFVNACTSKQNIENHSILDTPATIDSSFFYFVPEVLPADDGELFNEMFKRISVDIINDLPTLYEMPQEAIEWIKRQIEYNAYGGKMNRGLSVLSVHREFAKSKGFKLSNKDRLQSAALGWCIEFLQAFFLVADDIMDDSITRRGQPCWFRLQEVRLIAINDSFILESMVYKILKRYFGKEKCYPQLVDLFLEVTRQTEFGQLLDLTSQPLSGPIDLSRFTIERYNAIVKYKTAFYSFYLPVALGMIISGIEDRELFNKAREILLIMGEYFQVQDDFLDCYSTPEQIGKIGTDIQDNKCSWLIVQALKIANNKQRKVLEDNYGQHDIKKVAKVKKLYEDLNIKDLYHQYEEMSYRKIQSLIANVNPIPIGVFEFLLKKIYRRSK